jgi:TRAP-type C4-dicarboxylate transport system substrate-binding protein
MPRFIATLLLLLVSLQSHAGVTLKIATLLPDGTSWMQSMRAAAREIGTRTQGRVSLRFYPGGVMGNDKSVLRKIRAGQLHGGMITAGGLATIAADIQAYSLPFLFRSFAEVDHVRALNDPLLLASLQERGFTSFGLMEGGFVYLMTQTPVSSIAELRTTKVWAPEGDQISRIAYDELGVSPIPLPLSDVLTGLQTGLIETIGASPVAAIALQWHTRVKYLTDAPVLYLYGSLVIKNNALKRLDQGDRAILNEVLQATSRHLNDANRRDNQQARAALGKRGIETVTPAASDMAQWRATVDRASTRLTNGDGGFSPDVIPRIQKAIAGFRKRQ